MIKMRQSHIFNQSNIGGEGLALPMSQFVSSQFGVEMDDAADPNLNQEQEEAELHKKLNEEEPEAIEYYDFNILNLWVSEQNPVFLTM